MTRSMVSCALVVMVLGGCDRGSGDKGKGKGTAPVSATDLSTPEGAARCQLAAVRGRSLDGWLSCMHPERRDEFRTELQKEIERDPAFWTDAAEKLAPLQGVEADDFTLVPMRTDTAKWGDRAASYRFSERGKIELIRKGGQWYVVDPD